MYLIWILIIFLAIRLVFGWLLPIILPFIMKRLMKKHAQDFQAFNETQKNKEDNPPKFTKPKSNTNNNDDEYIDFEEVK